MSLLTKANFVHTVANVAAILFVVVILLQLLLAAGILPISMAWGGRQTELTPALRAASIVAAVLLGVFIYVIRYRAGLLGSLSIPGSIRIISWIVTGFLALNTVGNLTSLSNSERLLFGPIGFVLTIACLIVSASSAKS